MPAQGQSAWVSQSVDWSGWRTLGISTNIPPPTLGAQLQVLVSAHMNITSAGLHMLSMGTSTMTDDTSSILQQLVQVPSVTGSMLLQAVYTAPLHELLTSALNPSFYVLQPPCDIPCSPGLSPGTAPDTLGLHLGGGANWPFEPHSASSLGWC